MRQTFCSLFDLVLIITLTDIRSCDIVILMALAEES